MAKNMRIDMRTGITWWSIGIFGVSLNEVYHGWGPDNRDYSST